MVKFMTYETLKDISVSTSESETIGITSNLKGTNFSIPDATCSDTVDLLKEIISDLPDRLEVLIEPTSDTFYLKLIINIALDPLLIAVE
ncbi:hypothetical protein BGZ49_007345 [Haplosporangium sp. Z 27]|nr:hypothetical protein BGZ49_007345 [Haplosporangium sp. Z 27]